MHVERVGLGTTLIEYHQGWERQRTIHRQVAAGDRDGTVLLLEHRAVYTAGRRTQPEERPFDGTPVVDVDRGGKITWHGPGQLVGYPIVRLPEQVYVVDYVRRLEEALIQTLAGFGLVTGRVAGRSGVWLAADERRPERKIAAIGVRVAQGTTMHGFALNVAPDMAGFANIVPCGIADAGVTSLREELGHAPTLTETADRLEPHLRTLLAFAPYQRSADLPSTDAPGQPTAGVIRYGVQV